MKRQAKRSREERLSANRQQIAHVLRDDGLSQMAYTEQLTNRFIDNQINSIESRIGNDRMSGLCRE